MGRTMADDGAPHVARSGRVTSAAAESALGHALEPTPRLAA